MGRAGDVRHGAVRGQAERAPERAQARRRVHRLRAGAAVQAPGKRVVGVVGRKHADLMVALLELVGESLDVAGDPAGIGPGVRRDQGDPHAAILPWVADGDALGDRAPRRERLR